MSFVDVMFVGRESQTLTVHPDSTIVIDAKLLVIDGPGGTITCRLEHVLWYQIRKGTMKVPVEPPPIVPDPGQDPSMA